MARKLPNLFGRASAVTSDHAHLRSLLTRLHDFFHAPAELAGRAEAWRLLVEFASELRTHFGAEEAGGYFGALVAERPHLRSRVEQLRAEHLEITVFLTPLTGASEDAVNSGTLDSQVRKLLEIFQDHERKEALLIQEFLGRDGG